MEWKFNIRHITRLQHLGRLLSLLALVVGLAGVVSWIAAIPFLRIILSGGADMKFNTSVGICLAAASLLLPPSYRLNRILAWGVFSLGAANLFQVFAGVDLGIDNLFFQDQRVLANAWPAGRMSPNTAVCFLLFGLSANWLHAHRNQYTRAQGLAILLLSLSYAALFGHLLSPDSFQGIVLILSTSLPACVGFLCLALALLFRHPDKGITTVLSSAYVGSTLARKAFTGIFFGPLLLGVFNVFWIRVYHHPLAMSTLLIYILLFLAMDALSAFFSFQELNGLHAQRTSLLEENETINHHLKHVNEELRASNEELETSLEEYNAVNEKLAEAHNEIQALMEERLQQSEHKFRQLTESITEMFMAVDNEGNYVYWNQACEKFFGLKAEIVLGKSIYQVFPTFAESKNERTFLEIMQHRQKATLEANLMVKGSQRDMRLHLFPSKTGLSALVEDITEQKTKENEILKLNRQLTERNHELDQIVYKISHDIRAPLTSVMGLINVMKLPGNANESANYLNLMENRVDKLDRFVQSMLDFSRNTRTQVATERVDIYDIIQQCLQDLAYNQLFSRIHFETKVSGEPFNSDPFRLKIIFLNIISNAIKYQHTSREQSYLNIQIEVDTNRALIRFEDNGIGIDEKHLPQIFDMFFRASQQSAGSGLGMYIVKQTVERLEGTIHLESRLGQGTRIIVSIPNVHLSGTMPPAIRVKQVLK